MKTFFLVLRQLALPEGESEGNLAARAARRLGCPPEAILDCRPVRRSLDARKRNRRALWIYHVRLEMPAAWRARIRSSAGLDIEEEKRRPRRARDAAPPADRRRPLVVGAGPAGMFAALRLARAGWRPVLVERGDAVGARRSAAAAFWKDGRLDPESNPLFGEGGAGLFSDGKLNTRHKDREGVQAVLRALVAAGAPEDVLVAAEPHLGSDILGDVTAALVREIGDLGGEVRRRCRLERLEVENGAVRAAGLVRGGVRETLEVDACVLATGHSARDVYEMLARCGVALVAKAFAAGLRVEMPQAAIDASQRDGKRGKCPGAASFRMSLPPANGRVSCYTFCMCPGGMVIACASEPGRLAVNGMSFSARAGDWGNAAFLSPVSVEDFAVAGDGAGGPLAGVAFQRFWEGKAYRAGLPGGEYAVPASSLDAFARGEAGALPALRSVGRAVAANLRELLPPRLGDSLALAIPAMVARLRKVDAGSIVLYGVETRTSSPVRVVRGEDGASVSTPGLYPAGEGAGYAGGIVTSALDGWRAAGSLMRRGVQGK